MRAIAVACKTFQVEGQLRARMFLGRLRLGNRKASGFAGGFLLAKIAGTQRYRLTSRGRRVAVLSPRLTAGYSLQGLSALDPRLPEDVTARSNLSTAWRGFEKVPTKPWR